MYKLRISKFKLYQNMSGAKKPARNASMTDKLAGTLVSAIILCRCKYTKHTT